MAKVLFSSWNGKVIDGRNMQPDERPDLVQLKLPPQVEGEELKAFIGWGGLVIVDPAVNVVAALRDYFKCVQGESCGRCIPCRVGSKVIAYKLEKLLQGRGEAADLEQLERWGRLLKDTSLCELGQSSPLPLLEALKYFREDFAACLEGKGIGANRPQRLHCILTAPCQNGCPAHINIPKYIACIKHGDYEEALATVREKTPLAGVLGRVCVHPCEANCRRLGVDEALSIRVLKRFVADYEVNKDIKATATAAAPSGKKVAVVGAGPAGLNAAYMLAMKGHKVVIFEALPVAGGMLAVGIPSYRLPRDILQAEVDMVKSAGVEIKLNTRIGTDIPFKQMLEDYDAVFIASGLHDSGRMGVEGEDAGYTGFMPGVEYLRKINLGRKMELGERVAVIGGGNVAMDCARSSLRLGIKEVNLIYRRSRAEMPANEVEIIAAEEEGVRFHLQANPTRILHKNGRVTGLECIRMELGEPDSSGRRRPVPVKGSEFVLDVDMVVPATGQVADLSFLQDSGVKITERGVIQADPLTMATSLPKVFAAGDAVLGARTVIEAVASANKAASAIDAFLREGRAAYTEATVLESMLEKLGVYDPQEKPAMIGGRARQEEEVLPVSDRLQGFGEVDLGFRSPREALREADRCATCLRLGLFIT